MQTFVPFADFTESALVLDNKRLNKQLLEGRQIYQIIASNKTKGAWTNHPAVNMWRNCDVALFHYLLAIKDECVARGIQTEKNWTAILSMHQNNWYRGENLVMPLWWGDERVHESHRNNLYVKDPQYYAQFSKDNRVACCSTCNYFWPTHTLYYNAELMEVINV